MPCSDPRMRGPREVSLFEEPPSMTPAEIAALHEYWARREIQYAGMRVPAGYEPRVRHMRGFRWPMS